MLFFTDIEKCLSIINCNCVAQIKHETP